MNDRNRYTARIGELLYYAFLRIRSSHWNPETAETAREEIADLADLLHNIPRWMAGLDEHAIASAEQFRDAVADHVKRFYPKTKPEEHKYLRLLDMSDEEFDEQYPRRAWLSEPEVVPA